MDFIRTLSPVRPLTIRAKKKKMERVGELKYLATILNNKLVIAANCQSA